MQMRWLLLSTIAALSTAVSATAASDDGQIRDAQIRDTMSAAPPAIAANATVIIHDKNSHRIVARQGSNGWTCHAAPLRRDPGDDPLPKPACFDANGLAFMQAFMAGHAPDPNRPGYSYMLQGGSGWSNTDPMAAKLAPGRKDFIRIPPHVMILSAKIANGSGLPLHETDPDTSKPFVMFGGTPFALMIIPVK